MLENKVKLIYISGSPFSGTTLFGLGLGGYSDVLNLGEVFTLENDYNEARKCTCGEVLDSCPFWSRVRSCIVEKAGAGGVNFSLDDKSSIDPLDRRYSTQGWLFGLKTLLFKKYRRRVSEHDLLLYKEKNSNFFRAIQSCFPNIRAIVDCSKNIERLEVLSTCVDLEICNIFLYRQPEAIFASSIKRFNKRRFCRPLKVFPVFLAKFLHTLWLRRSMARAKASFDSTEVWRKIEVSFEEFLDDPRKVLDGVIAACGLEGEWDDNVSPGAQHLYVGNRWIFIDSLSVVKFERRDDLSSLSVYEKMLMVLFF